jgi:hypothetical protein
MAEGLDYPNVGTVVIYGGGDFYIKHHILTRDRLHQMIGRTGRNFPGCAVLHESLRELYTNGNTVDFSYTQVRHNTDVCELFHVDLLNNNSIDTRLLVNFRVFYEYSCDKVIEQLRRFCTGDLELHVSDIANVMLVGGITTEIIPALIRISKFENNDTTYGIFILPFLISIFAYRDILSLRDDSDRSWTKPDWKLRMDFVVHDPFSFLSSNEIWVKPDWSKSLTMWSTFHDRCRIVDHFNNIMEISEFNVLRPKISFAKLEDVIMAFNDIDIDPKYFRYMWSFTWCLISIVLQSRSIWDYCFPSEPPIQAMIIARHTMTRYGTQMTRILPPTVTTLSFIQVLNAIETDLFNDVNDVYRSNQLIQPLVNMEKPYGRTHFVMKDKTYRIKQKHEISKSYREIGLLHIVSCIVQKDTFDYYYHTLLQLDSLNVNKCRIPMCYYSWVLSINSMRVEVNESSDRQVYRDMLWESISNDFSNRIKNVNRVRL